MKDRDFERPQGEYPPLSKEEWEEIGNELADWGDQQAAENCWAKADRARRLEISKFIALMGGTMEFYE